MKYTNEQIEWAKNEISNTNRPRNRSFEIIAEKFNITRNAVAQAYHSKCGWLNDGEGYNPSCRQVKNPKICMAIIKKHPDNLRHAFRLASKETNQSVSVISNSYYLEGGNLNEIKNKKTIFRIIGFFNIFRKNMKNNIAKGKTSL